MRFLQAWAVGPRFSALPPKLHFGVYFYEKMFYHSRAAPAACHVMHTQLIMAKDGCFGVPLKWTSSVKSSGNKLPREFQAQYLIFQVSNVKHHVSNGV